VVQLQTQRLKTANDHDLPDHYKLILRDVKAHSDDEWDPAKQVFVIKQKVSRSASATALVRWLDDLRADSLALPSGRNLLRKRVEPEVPVLSNLRSLPRCVPLDYYDPNFYNRLPRRVKHMCSNVNMGAFPLDIQDIPADPQAESEAMSDAALYDQYAGQILQGYTLPGDEDAYSPDNDDEDDDMITEDEDEDTGLSGGEDLVPEEMLERDRAQFTKNFANRE
jgi:hypothetical protein